MRYIYGLTDILLLGLGLLALLPLAAIPLLALIALPVTVTLTGGKRSVRAKNSFKYRTIWDPNRIRDKLGPHLGQVPKRTP